MTNRISKKSLKCFMIVALLITLLPSYTITSNTVSASVSSNGVTTSVDMVQTDSAVNKYYDAAEHTYVKALLAQMDGETYQSLRDLEKEEAIGYLISMLGESGFKEYMKATLTAYGIEYPGNNITIRGKSYDLNIQSFSRWGQIVYGEPKDITNNQCKTSLGTITDMKNCTTSKSIGEPRYVGYSSTGEPIHNIDFAPDALSTTNVGKRSWLREPWTEENRNTIYNNHLPYRSDFMDVSKYDSKLQARWLNGIIDNYLPGETRGNFNPNWPGHILINYAVIEEAPTDIYYGQATMWHRSYYDASSKAVCDTKGISGKKATWQRDYMELK